MESLDSARSGNWEKKSHYRTWLLAVGLSIPTAIAIQQLFRNDLHKSAIGTSAPTTDMTNDTSDNSEQHHGAYVPPTENDGAPDKPQKSQEMPQPPPVAVIDRNSEGIEIVSRSGDTSKGPLITFELDGNNIVSWSEFRARVEAAAVFGDGGIGGPIIFPTIASDAGTPLD